MRPVLPALAAAALLLAGLTACTGASSAGTASSKGCPAAPSGSSSESVKVSGKSSAEPTVKIAKALKVSKTERTVVSAGKGDTVANGSLITWSYTLYNGTTKKKIGAVGYGTSGGAQTFTVSDNSIPGLAKTLKCTTEGSRVVSVIPPKDAFGSTGQTQLGIGAKDDLVVIADVHSIVPSKADGSPQKAETGFPKVSIAKSGKPTLTVPAGDPPAEFKLEVLKKGTGATVKDGDSVTVQYQGTNWTSKKVFDQSWGKTPATFTTSGVIAGFTKALVGQRVGSQVVAIIPPADGYGPMGGQASAGISATDTLVFVIDILAASPAAG